MGISIATTCASSAIQTRGSPASRMLSRGRRLRPASRGASSASRHAAMTSTSALLGSGSAALQRFGDGGTGSLGVPPQTVDQLALRQGVPDEPPLRDVAAHLGELL